MAESQSDVNLDERAEKSLVSIIGREVPRAIKNRKDDEVQAIVELFRSKLEGADGMYDSATVKLPFWQLEALNKEQLKHVSEEILKVIMKSVNVKKFDNQDLVFFESESPVNLLFHEYDHLKMLPDRLRHKASCDISFVREKGKIRIKGTASFDVFGGITDSEMAILASEPRVLSERDIIDARKHALNTGDNQFIEKIEHRIACRRFVDVSPCRIDVMT